jgi:ankyrin repeat protein
VQRRDLVAILDSFAFQVQAVNAGHPGRRSKSARLTAAPAALGEEVEDALAFCVLPTPVLGSPTSGHASVAKRSAQSLEDPTITDLFPELLRGCSCGVFNAVARALQTSPAEIVNRKNAKGDTPLMCACSTCHPSITAVLLGHGADPTAKNPRGETALHMAALVGEEASVRLLVAAGADVNAVDSNQKATPIHNASLRKHFVVVSRLLLLGADINARTDDGSTCLHLACSSFCGLSSQQSSIDLVRLLVSKGADLRARTTTNGVLALHVYAQSASATDL